MNFQIETVSFCDLTCSECPNVYMKRERAIMKREVWDTILRDYVIPCKHINAHRCPPAILPHKDGEPLLNKFLIEYLQAASALAPDINIDVYTHGLLLPKRPGFVEQLGKLPNKIRLLISFHFHNHDGSTNDYGPLTDWLSATLARKTPVNVEFILASHLIAPMTREKLDAWKLSWADLERDKRVTVHANVNINPWAGYMEDKATCHFDGCAYGNFESMFFGATGNVVACCLDLEEEIVFGNVMRDDPKEVFGQVEAFYAAKRRREVEHRVCRNCFGLPPEPALVQLGRISA